MRATEYLLSTLKETPSDAEVISHQLMLRAGLIRKLASGLYTWTPIGLKTLNKVKTIIQEEMDAVGALEVSMPVTQPSELWQQSNRWDQYGPELLRFKDRHDRDFCLGPTHEEVITELARNELSSYKQLPICFYQIQTKFRDEIRPRFGVMRSREFLMKDAYSFHIDQASLQNTYDKMYEAYHRIFTRIGLNFRAVIADTGSIGGNHSHEFHVLAESGEDDIAFSDSSEFAANIEMAEALAPTAERMAPQEEMSELTLSDVTADGTVCEQLSIPAHKLLKTWIVKSGNEEAPYTALVVRGDHTLNEIKAEKLAHVSAPFTFASDEEILTQWGCQPNAIGPYQLNIPVIADHSAFAASDFVIGANAENSFFSGANWLRDIAEPIVSDIRNIEAGDPSPCGKGTIHIKRGIEVGHIFQLGTKYSEAMQAKVLDESGKQIALNMGCYGIGVTRIVAAAIEQHHDNNGIILPASIAPFDVAIVPINKHKSEAVSECCETLYKALSDAGYSVLYMDENKARLGGMLANVELIGIPHRFVVGDRGLEKGELEYRARDASENQQIAIDDAISILNQ